MNHDELKSWEQTTDAMLMRAESEIPESAPVDIVVSRLWLTWDKVLIWGGAFLAFFCVMSVCLFLAPSGIFNGRVWLYPIGASLVGAVLIAPPVLFLRWRILGRVRDQLDRACTGLVRGAFMALHDRRPLMTGDRAFYYFVGSLARNGIMGRTFRILLFRAAEIRPIGIPFEARVLNETEPSFRELYDAAFGAPPMAGGDGSASVIAWPLDEATHGLKRRYAMGGLWLLGGALLMVVNLIQDWRASSGVTWTFVALLAAFIPLLVQVIKPQGLRTWHLVPGGVYVQAGGNRSRLFGRADSNLLIIQRSPLLFEATVSDGESIVQTLFTKAEIALLLAGWNSEVQTPTREAIAGLS